MASLDESVIGISPFNNTLETGIRAVVLLEAFYPHRCDLIEMTWLDHIVVHTGDLDKQNAPESLHPDLPNRTGELLVRRQLVEKSLRLMQRVHLVEVFQTENGIEFCASEDAPSYLALLQSPYSLALKQRASWIADWFRELKTIEIQTIIESHIGRWTAEFRADDKPIGLLI